MYTVTNLFAAARNLDLEEFRKVIDFLVFSYEDFESYAIKNNCANIFRLLCYQRHKFLTKDCLRLFNRNYMGATIDYINEICKNKREALVESLDLNDDLKRYFGRFVYTDRPKNVGERQNGNVVVHMEQQDLPLGNVNIGYNLPDDYYNYNFNGH